MKIKRRLTLNTWISLGVIVLIALSLTWSFMEIKRTGGNKDLVDAMQRVTLDRTSHRDDYLLHREERAKLQWQIASETMRRLLESASERFTDEEDQALLQEARKNFDATFSTFSAILAIHKQEVRAAKKRTALDETESRMTSQLLLKAYALQDSIYRLGESADRAETRARTKGIILTVFIILGGVVAVVVNSTMLKRILTQRVTALNKGLRIIGDGNLDYRIDMQGDDELSDLGRAGNEMAAKLKESHASVEILQREITERKQAEEKLKKSEEKYLKTFQSNPVCVGLTRLSDGLVIEANEVMLKLLGYSDDEFIWHTMPELGVWNDPADRERLLRTLTAEGRSMNQEYWLRTKTGELLLCNHSAELIQLDNEPHIIFTFFDITERKKMEQALAEYTVRLEEANKELESFSYSVSHDLRAPLRAVDGYTRSILKKQGDKFDEDTTRKFNEIRSNTKMMGQLIDDLLAFSRLSRKDMSMSELNMVDLIRDVWKELNNINPYRTMHLIVNSTPRGYGDAALVKQVYHNLLSNAVKFTRLRDDAHIEVGGYNDGNEDVFYVKDNGVGFDMKYYDKLFGVFQRLHNDPDFEGTGVGLATVQRIIHRQGGRVWAEGKVNEGATFYFTLPHIGNILTS
jgi:PAS domain S-box-containing protein